MSHMFKLLGIGIVDVAEAGNNLIQAIYEKAINRDGHAAGLIGDCDGVNDISHPFAHTYAARSAAIALIESGFHIYVNVWNGTFAVNTSDKGITHSFHSIVWLKCPTLSEAANSPQAFFCMLDWLSNHQHNIEDWRQLKYKVEAISALLTAARTIP